MLRYLNEQHRTRNNVLFCERNLQNFSHSLRPSNTSCFPPGWDKLLSGHFCALSCLWKQQVVKGTKMNRGGRKSYPNTVEHQKKFQPEVEQDCRGFFLFFSPSPSSKLRHLIPHWMCRFTRCLRARCAEEESLGTVTTSQIQGEEGLPSCWDDSCAFAPSQRHRGKKEKAAEAVKPLRLF